MQVCTNYLPLCLYTTYCRLCYAKYICSKYTIILYVCMICLCITVGSHPFHGLVRQLQVEGRSYSYYDLTALQDERYGTTGD